MSCLIGFLSCEYGNTARTKGFFEQNKAVVGELDNRLQRNAAKPLRLEGVSLIQKHLGWQKKAGATSVREQIRSFFHEPLSDLLCSTASPWGIAHNHVELTSPSGCHVEEIRFLHNWMFRRALPLEMK